MYPILRGIVMFAGMGVTILGVCTSIASAGTCSSPGNAIQAENCLPGTPQSQWDVTPDSNGVPGAGDRSIQGFATDMSVNVGSTISFKVSSTASAYRLDIYRMGYYSGMGARLVTSIQPSVALPQTQPPCLTDPPTGLLDCGNWAVSASWAVPSNAVSGIYFARLVRSDNGGASHIFFTVRNEASHSAVLFQTSDATWQAYNFYGGPSLYGCNGQYNAGCRAYKVSYNRPFYTRSFSSGSWVFNAEYPMVRWLEANGYDVSYSSEIDSDRFGNLLLNHKVFMSVGHDEYWSGNQRANVEAARNAGVHLAFFSGNESFWKVRWENSIDGSGTPYRTLVCYKETHNNAPIDSEDPPIWTGTWRDPRFSPPADGGRPENELSGTIFLVNGPRSDSITVSDEEGQMRFWRRTAAAALAFGGSYSTPPGTLGYEWDVDLDNGSRPAGLFDLSTSTLSINNNQYLLDFGSTFGTGIATHSLTLYRYQDRSLVFGAGTVQWSWGLDSNHDNGSAPADVSMQQATVNLLADMGVQPVSLQSGLVAASPSTDTSAPASTIIAPVRNANLAFGTPIAITGMASDVGGGVVAGVEISIDGGTTWHPATGRSAWTYLWAPAAEGSYTIRTRSVDDSGNLEAPTSGINVAVRALTVPSAVTNVVATGGNGRVTLDWSASAGAATYSIARAAVPAGPYVSIANGVTAMTYSDTTASNGTTYYYEVSAVNSRGRGASSPSVNALPQLALANCPSCLTIFGPNATPAIADVADTSQPVELGVSFRTDVNGYVLGVRFYKGDNNLGTHTGNLWTDAGVLLASGTFTNETASGWQTVWFNAPVPVAANSNYVASYFAPYSNFARDFNYFATSGVDNSPLHAPANVAVGGNGLYTYSSTSAFPSTPGYESSNYWVDVIFETTDAPAPPGGVIPFAGNGRVTLDWTVAPGVSGYNIKRASVSGGPYTSVASGVTAGTYTDTGLVNGATYYYVVSATNSYGEGPNSIEVSAEPQQPIASCPLCFTIWGPTVMPAVADVPGSPLPVELGVRFRTDVNGYVLGVRFYKGINNIGVHLGNLWTVGGSLLASATFTNETTSGWQTVWFANPVPVTANSNYIASYFAPTSNFARDLNYFASTGVDNSPLHAPSNGALGANGLYSYSPTSAFPTTAGYQSSNYWVDVVFETAQVPSAPTGLTASAADTQTTLSWTATPTATTYAVKRSTTSGGPYTTVATGVTSTSYVNTGLTNGATYFYVIAAANAQGAGPNSAQVSAIPHTSLQVTTTSLPSGTVMTSYSSQVSASGGITPYSWSAAGLPSGLSMSSAGVISGTPTVGGTTTVSVTVTDTASDVVTKSLSLTVNVAPLQITSGSPPVGAPHERYSFQFSASGGVQPYTWSISGLPSGLSMSSGGLLSGTPEHFNFSQITVKVTDAQRTSTTASYRLIIY